MKVLVTGGAGYIGSVAVATLLAAGHDVVVIDDLSSGHRDAVPSGARFIECDVGRTTEIAACLRAEGVAAIVHFAGKLLVEESGRDPRLYWNGNVRATLGLLDAVLAECPQVPFVFSSTAAVYAGDTGAPLREDDPLGPASTYGRTKHAVEQILAAYGRAYGLRWAALRYFNAAGAWPEAGLGERHDPETHLIPIALDVAAGARDRLTIYGTDWPTSDGTCVRDFIHVRDLADAHVAAIGVLAGGRDVGAINVGTGRGTSVRDVVGAIERTIGRELPATTAGRRDGDVAMTVADVARAKRVLGWEAQRSLDTIVRDAWEFLRREA